MLVCLDGDSADLVLLCCIFWEDTSICVHFYKFVVVLPSHFLLFVECISCFSCMAILFSKFTNF